MYFKDRYEAGQELAEKLFDTYRYEDCAIIALSEGAVLVGEPIATLLHCVMTMMLVESIEVPGESVSLGGLSQAGQFTYNGALSSGQLEAFKMEYFGYFEEKKREAMGRLNRLLGDGGLLNREMLKGRNIILVADGFTDTESVDVALDFLKPVSVKKIIIATPTASIQAVDYLHIKADELHILDVKANFMGINHYYDINEIPSREDTVEKLNRVVLNWQ